MKILTTEQMHQAEKECASAGLSTEALMENAGKAVAEEVGRILGTVVNQRVLFLIGPGNNGGDGLVTARHLQEWGAKASVYLASARPPEDPNLAMILKHKVTCIEVSQDEMLGKFDTLLDGANAVIDALFGTGAVRPFSGITLQLLDKVNRAKKKRRGLRIIALDLPSGLSADTGDCDPGCLYADNTITLGFPKPGLFLSSGSERVGKLSVVDIGIPTELVAPVNTELLTLEWARSVIPERPLNANKGNFGKVLVVAGSINYIGAAYLASSGAIRVGAGLVTLATAMSLQSILASKLTEVTYLPLPESRPGLISPEAVKVIHPQLNQFDVLLLGCGLGQSQSALKFIELLLLRRKPELPLVLDADALNTLATIPNWWQHLTSDGVLTPHPGEMARLTGLSVDEVQSNRIDIARKAAETWHKTVVLKGAYTVTASPEGKCLVSPVANPGLASAGTGDVLTGVIAGLLAQGLGPFEAAALGVYLHGEAGEVIREKLGDAGMVASDLLPVLPVVIKELNK